MVFSHSEYYPCGGLGDVRESFDTLVEALEWCNNNLGSLSSDGWYFFDREIGKVVYSFPE